MFVKVKLNSNLALGSVVSYNSTDQNWQLAQNAGSMLGIVQEVEHDLDTQIFWGIVVFAETCNALADRAIPDEGGYLAVNNGRVYVDPNADHCGIISPLPRGQESRIENDLVMVYLR
jgi:hypothetical protein